MDILDNNCNTAALDGLSLPRREGSHLLASCRCGHTVRLDLTNQAAASPCDCGLPAAEAVVNGPHFAALFDHRPKPSDDHNVVYFARVSGLVKIGTTGNLPQRLAALGHPDLLGHEPGGYQREREVHAKFATARIHGEVFELTDSIRQHIAEYCTTEQPQRATPPRRPNRSTPWRTIQRQQQLRN